MKRTLISGIILLLLIGFTGTVSATTISVTGLNGWTPVQFTYNQTWNEYAGEILLNIDGHQTSGYCIDLYDTTRVPSGPFTTNLTALDQNWELQAAWLMNQYGGRSTVENAALQVAIWKLEYNGLVYTGSTSEGSVGDYLQTYLTALGDNTYDSAGYEIAPLAPNAQNLLVKASAPVPEPTTMLLLGSGLICIAGFRKKIKK